MVCPYIHHSHKNAYVSASLIPIPQVFYRLGNLEMRLHVYDYIPAESMSPPTFHVPSRLEGQILSNCSRRCLCCPSLSPVCPLLLLLLPRLPGAASPSPSPSSASTSLLGLVLDANGIAAVRVGAPTNTGRVVRKLLHSQLHVVLQLFLGHHLGYNSLKLVEISLFSKIQWCIPYSRKIWRGIKFGGLAVYITTTKLKSAKISCSYIYIYMWQSRTEPPNLNLPCNSDFGLNRQI